MEKRKIKKAVKMSIVIVLLIVAGISIGVIIKDYQSEQESLRKQQELQQLWNSSSSSSSVTSTASSDARPYAKEQFAELIGINPDLVGWLEVGELSAPVVQRDNNEYYLTHDFYGKEDPHGTVFVDSRNDVDGWNDNMVLYGHNYKKSKQIFYEVERYKDPQYAATHPVFSFTGLHERQEYVVIALFYSNTVPEQGEVFNYHDRLSFDTTDEMNSFITDLRSRSLLTTDIEASYHDSLMTLSTCGYDFNGQRIVLVGRLLRDDETAESFANTVYSTNPAPIMPELWTKLYGKK